MQDLHVSWDEYNRLVERLAVKIHASGWEFDAIVCLARGGLRVGDILSRVFERPLGVLFVSSYREAAGTQQGPLIVGDHLASAAPLPGGRWLLVDDLADSGITLQEVPPVLRQRYPEITELRSAVLWLKAASVAVPDFWLEYLPDNPWIHQPFEEYDRLGAAELYSRKG